VFKKQLYLFFIVISLSIFNCISQENSSIIVQDSLKVNSNKYNPLSPAKAAFYSAVLPGLGQAYNKKYWKIPFVYAALGSGVYFYNANNKNYNRIRDAYKLRINEKPDEFDGLNGNVYLSKEALVSAQKAYRKDRDLSLLVTIGLYVLQIVEASTNAHLLQHNVDKSLTLNPKLIQDNGSNKTIVGASLNFNF